MSDCICLDFINYFNRKYPDIWKHTEELQSENDLWDSDVCYFPIGCVMTVLHEYYGVPEFQTTNHAAIISGLAGWRIEKRVYQYDTDICSMLFEQAKNAEDMYLPSDIFKLLPAKAVYIKYPEILSEKYNNERTDNIKVDGFITWVENDLNDMSYELRMVHLGTKNKENIILTNNIAHLIPNKTISDGIDKTLEIAKSHSEEMGVHTSAINNVINSVGFLKDYKDSICRDIQLILYICASNADITENERQKGIYKFNKGFIRDKFREVQIFDVGDRISNAKRDNVCGNSSSKSPHIRSAHWHHYWIGKKNEKKTRILKWLNPMFINGGVLEDTDGDNND